MNYPLPVGCVERICDLPRDCHDFAHGNGPTRDALRERLAFGEFQHQRAYAAAFLDAVNGGDVWMLERGKRLRLALKPGETFGIRCEGVRQKFQCDIALEPRVARTVDLSHAPGSKSGNDLIRSYTDAWTE